MGIIHLYFMNKKILLIGKTSYIGINLEKRLQKNNNIILISPSSKECNLLDFRSISLYIENIKLIDSLVFLAVIKKNKNNNFFDFLNSIKMTINVLRIINRSKCKHVLFTSTTDIYGKNPALPINENNKFKVDTYYNTSKFISEKLFSLSSKILKFSLSIFRIPGVYGYNHKDRSVVHQLIKKVINNEEININNLKNIKRDYLYIDDLCKLIEISINKRINILVNVVSGRSITLDKIATTIFEVFEKKTNIKYNYSDDRSFSLDFDNKKLMKIFNYKFMNFEDVIEQYKNFYRK